MELLAPPPETEPQENPTLDQALLVEAVAVPTTKVILVALVAAVDVISGSTDPVVRP